MTHPQPNVKSSAPRTPPAYQVLGNPLNNYRWNIIITRVIEQLREYYIFDGEAQALQKALIDLQNTLLPNDNKDENEDVKENEDAKEKEAEKEATRREKLKVVDEHIRLFRGLNPSQFKKCDPHTISLICLLETALTNYFPAPLNSTLEAFLQHPEDTIHNKKVPITEENQSSVIPTSERVLHFLEFILPKSADHAWQDVIRAIYRAKQLGVPEVNQKTFRLSKTKNIPTEQDLLLIDEKSHEVQEHTHCIFLQRLQFYYEMINRGVSQAQMLFWDKRLQEQKELDDFITMLFRCRELHARISYQKNLPPGSGLHIALKNLAQEIDNHTLAAVYLKTKEGSTVSFQESIEQILINLTSPIIYHLIQDQGLPLEAALQFSKEERIKHQEAYQRAQIKSYPQYDQLTSMCEFKEFLKYARIDSQFFLKEIQKTSSPEGIINHLKSHEVLSHITKGIQTNTLNWQALLLSSENLENYLESVIQLAKKSTMLSDDVLKYVKQYNQEEAQTQITLSTKERKELKPLEGLSLRFADTLRSNPLAEQVLTKHNCTNLIAALVQYGELSEKLQAEEKDCNEIITLARYCCFNIQKEAKGTLLAIDSGFPLSEGLFLPSNRRKDFLNYYTALFNLLPNYSLVEVEERDAWIRKRLTYIIQNIDDTSEGIAHYFKDDLLRFNNPLLIGLVDGNILYPSEIANFSTERMHSFHAVSSEDEQSAEAVQEVVSKQEYYNLAEMVSEIPNLKQKRKALDKLKKDLGDTSDVYIVESEEYFSSVVKYIQYITSNVNSASFPSLWRLIQAGANPELLLVARKERRLIQTTYKESHSNYQSVKKNPSIVAILKEEKSLNYEKLLQKVLKLGLFYDHKIYSQVSQSLDYLRSETIQAYLKADFLTFDQIISLTPESFDALERANLVLNSNNLKYNDCLKQIFKEYIPTGKIIDLAAVTPVIEIGHKVLDYLSRPLLGGILFDQMNSASSKKLEVKELAAAINERNTYSEETLQARFQRSLRKDAVIGTILGKYKTYHSFLLAAYKADPQNTTPPFSLQRIFESCSRYLDSIHSDIFKKLCELGFDPIVVICTPDHEKDAFEAQFNLLNRSSHSRKSKSREGKDDKLLEFVTWSINRHPNSVAHVTQEIDIAHHNLGQPLIAKLRRRKLRSLSIMKLPSKTSALLESWLKNWREHMAPQSEETEACYRDLCQFINDSFKLENSIALIHRGISILSLPIVQAILYSGYYSVASILNATKETFSTFEKLEKQLILLEKENILNDWVSAGQYQNIAHIIVDSITSTQSANTPLAALLRKLSDALDALTEHESRAYRLVSLGVSPHIALNTSKLSNDQNYHIDRVLTTLGGEDSSVDEDVNTDERERIISAINKNLKIEASEEDVKVSARSPQSVNSRSRHQTQYTPDFYERPKDTGSSKKSNPAFSEKPSRFRGLFSRRSSHSAGSRLRG